MCIQNVEKPRKINKQDLNKLKDICKACNEYREDKTDIYFGDKK